MRQTTISQNVQFDTYYKHNIQRLLAFLEIFPTHDPNQPNPWVDPTYGQLCAALCLSDHPRCESRQADDDRTVCIRFAWLDIGRGHLGAFHGRCHRTKPNRAHGTAPQLGHRTTPITALGRPCSLQNARNSFCVPTPPSLFHQLFITKWTYRDDTIRYEMLF